MSRSARSARPAIRTFAAGVPRGLRAVDARVRVAAAVVFAVTAVMLTTVTGLLAALAVAAGLALWARLPAAETARRMAAVDGFIVLTLLTLPFTTPGETLFALWGLPASREGLLHAVRIALTANAVILALLALVGTLDESTLGHALARLGVPDKLVHLFLMTVRYIEVLHQEYRRLRTAMTARGFRPGTNRHTLRSLGYLLGMLLVRSLERSERVLAAMKCRGFTGRFPLLDDLRTKPADWVFVAAGVVLCVGLVGADRGFFA